jgi:hypothetical protein
MSIGAPNTFPGTTFALNQAAGWVFGTSGRGIGFPFIAGASATLTDAWIYIPTLTSWPGATDGIIQVAVHNTSTTTRLPGTNIVTQNSPVISATGWVKVTFSSPPTLTAYTPYYLIVSDSDASTTSFPTILVNGSNSVSPSPFGNAVMVTSTSGFSVAGSASSGASAAAWKVGSIMYGGGPFVALATTSSNSLPVGNVYQFEEDMDLVGVYAPTDAAAIGGNTVALFKSTTPPSGVAELTAVMAASNLLGGDFSGVGVPLPVTTLLKNTKYYLVIVKAGNLTVPRVLSCGTGLDADLKKLLPNQGRCYRVIKTDAVTDSWTEDDTTLCYIGGIFVPSNQAAGGSKSLSYSGQESVMVI